MKIIWNVRLCKIEYYGDSNEYNKLKTTYRIFSTKAQAEKFVENIDKDKYLSIYIIKHVEDMNTGELVAYGNDIEIK